MSYEYRDDDCFACQINDHRVTPEGVGVMTAARLEGWYDQWDLPVFQGSHPEEEKQWTSRNTNRGLTRGTCNDGDQSQLR